MGEGLWRSRVRFGERSLEFFNEKIAHLSFMVCVSTNWRVGFTLDERRVALEGYRYLIR
jgi:hypothetical protein